MTAASASTSTALLTSVPTLKRNAGISEDSHANLLPLIPADR